MLSPRHRRTLLAAAAWTAYVWGTRLFLLLGGDESFAFKAVHTVLALVSLAFALAITRIALSARRGATRPFSRNSTVGGTGIARENEPAP